MLKQIFLSVVVFSISTATSAAKYWVDSEGSPVRDHSGTCVNSGFIKNQPLKPGCDPMDRVILLPNADGQVGAVLVSVDGHTQKVDKAYAAAHVGIDGDLETAVASQQEVNTRFGQLLKEQPLPPASFILRFVTGSATELTPDSEVVKQQLFKNLEQRSAPEIRLIGHTDTVGSIEANDELSKQRAQTVADLLSQEGLAGELLEVTGRGERELAVKTADNVDNADNRRVEISIR